MSDPIEAAVLALDAEFDKDPDNDPSSHQLVRIVIDAYSKAASKEPVDADIVAYVRAHGGMCRDCADDGPICPNDGLPCSGADKAIEHVIKALSYGIGHGFIKNLFAAPQPPVQTHHFDPDLAPGEYIVLIDTKGGAAEINGPVRPAPQSVVPQITISLDRRLGIYGKSFDGPNEFRAYTYEHGPNNDGAAALGRAFYKTGWYPDSIDQGLYFLKEFNSQGFGVFAIGDMEKHDQQEISPLPAADTLKIQRNELRTALKVAIDHIEHMSAFIATQRLGYSFESLGEDMPEMKSALESAPRSAAPNVWRPIETAPKDGTRLLLLAIINGKPIQYIGGFDPHWSGQVWVSENPKISGCNPLKWMPLPATSDPEASCLS